MRDTDDDRLAKASGDEAALRELIGPQLEALAAAMRWRIAVIHPPCAGAAAPAPAGSAPSPGGARGDGRRPLDVCVASRAWPDASGEAAFRVAPDRRVLVLHEDGLEAALAAARRSGLSDHPHLFVAALSRTAFEVHRVGPDGLSPLDWTSPADRVPLARDFAQVLAARRLMRRSGAPAPDHGRAAAANWVRSLALERHGRVAVSDVEPGIRRFVPAVARQDPVVYIHGGGLVHYDLDLFSPFLSHLADRLGATVFAVGYRKCPEVAAEVVLREILDRVTRVAHGRGVRRIMGDSIGGLIALYAAARALPGRFRDVVLLYPVLSLKRVFPSHEIYGEGLLLDDVNMRWFRRLVTPHLLAEGFDPVEGLGGRLGDARVTVVSAGCDVLADEAVAFSRTTPVRLVRFAHLPHDFCLYLHRIASATDAFTTLADVLTWETSDALLS